ncbi:MAG: membrane protein insertion efficiency factor YidD [Clostridia bacterium]|nr:membrane protein insertion efficiency factor YidD [Clostridia bacterium]
MKKCLIFLIRAYQKYISPLKKPTCRFYPTCSSYAIEAISKKGAWRGTCMAIRRICKCHPFHPGGYDPVE